MAEKVNILNIKEIFYEHGKIKFRYSRYLSADGTKWIRHGFMNLTKMVILFRQKIMKIFYFSSKKKKKKNRKLCKYYLIKSESKTSSCNI